MALDISTLFFMLGVTSALASLFVWFLRVTNPTVPGVMVVALSNTLLAAGYILISLRGVVPPFFSFLLANALLFLGFATFLSGLRRFFGRDDAAVRVLVQQVEDPFRMILVHHDVRISFGFKGD